MTSEYSVSVDWMEEFKNNPDRWINHGRDILRASCKHYDADQDNKNKDNDEDKTSNIEYQDYCGECDISEDCAEPMMNYAYPLHHEPTEEEILRIVKETSLSVMENQDIGEWFLVLCGGGMNLSQSIGYAYLICGYIPDSLAFNVSSQYGLNIGGKKYFELMKEVKSSLKNTMESYRNRIKRINEAIKEAKLKQKSN